MGIACHICGKIGAVQRPVDPPGTSGRRWACPDHFGGEHPGVFDLQTERIVQTVRKVEKGEDHG